MAGDPDYPPEFEALDCAFNAALNVADGDVALCRKLEAVLRNMARVAYGECGKALMREGVE